MFDKKTLEEMQKAMQALQGMKSGVPDLEASMKQLQAMKEMGMPGMDEAIKQLQDARAMIVAQQGNPAVTQGNTAQPAAIPKANQSQSKPTASVGRASESTNNIEFTALEGGFKWIDDTHVEFGSYPQTVDGGVKKILWRVLDKKNGELLLISEYILDGKQYQDKTDSSVKRSGKKEDIERARLPWERCDLRRWLNDYFYNHAFNAQEKSQIIERLCAGNGAYIHKSYKAKKLDKANISILDDDTYERYEDYGCNDTRDRVFLLNVQEALDYFKRETYVIDQTVWNANLDRDAKATDFPLNRANGKTVDGTVTYLLNPFDGETNSKVNGKWQKIKVGTEHIGSVKWWLRNMGINDETMNAANIPYHGSQVSFIQFGAIFTGGVFPVTWMGVRPAILIKDK